ncbi:MAG: lycopene cyclase family protein [Deltaproteobacteria bacterium]|nr:lycopene cyclase family protein [Deltaproteobacteria bacterium]MCB9787478.1 lycopene cyclase family protein [Deltaproteobacteria bacterium]
MTTGRADIVVAGGGPAGYLAAAALAAAGLAVTLVDPRSDARWPNRYGAFADELQAVGFGDVAGATWRRTEVRLDEARTIAMDRAYAAIDGEALRRRLAAELAGHGGVTVDAACTGADHDERGVTVHTSAQGAWRARLLVDATGHRPRFVTRRGPDPSAFQCAWGVLGEFEGPAPDPDTMTFMDWSEPGDGAPAGVPTFLYAMPLGEGRAFFEETALASRPAASFAYLRGRLDVRLRQRGVRVVRELEIERCLIPMDAPAPDRRQRVVGIGGAASLVHPATGYMLTHTMKVAQRLAAALAEGIRADRSPARLASAGWDAVWPAGERRLHAFYALGRDLLMGLDAEGTRDFFEAFFSLPEAAARAYLSRELAPARTALAMTRLYARFDPALRQHLHREVLRRPAELIRGLVGLPGAS